MSTMTLAEWRNVLQRVQREIIPQGARVVEKGALNIKTEWRRRWDHHPHIKHLPRAIRYETDRNAHEAWAYIGVDSTNLQAPLAHIIEYGSVNNAPIPGGIIALDIEAPRFIRQVADLAADLLLSRR